jgi:hypothetical protein
VKLAERREPIAFGLCLFVGLFATFRFPYFASWDGPAHAASARGLWQYEGAVSRLFRRDWFPSPNVVAHLYESALLPVFGPALADRLVAATCVALVACGVRYLARSVNPDSGALMSYAGLPIAFGWFVHAGQYSFLLGVGSAAAYLGWRLRSQAQDRWTRQPALIATALVWLYLCHIVPLAVVLLAHAVISLPVLRRRRWRYLVTQWIAAVPALALVAAYLSRSSSGGAERRSLTALGLDAITMREVLVAFSTRRELFVLASMIGLIAVLAVGLVWRRDLVRSVPAATLLAVTAAVLGALYWVVPTNVAGGGFLTGRLALLAIVLSIAAGGVLPRGFVRLVPLIALTSLLGSQLGRQYPYHEFSNDVHELMEAREFLTGDDVVLGLIMCDERDTGCASARASTTHPLSQATGFLMAHTGAADLTLYEAYFDYFPLQFRASTTPLDRLYSAAAEPSTVPAVNVLAYERATGVHVDVIVIWGWDAVADDTSLTELAALRAVLAAGYELVHTSRRGHVSVFKRI